MSTFAQQFIFLSLFISLSSCSYIMPHRIDIQQGNILEQEKVNQIQPSMRKDQVQFILGTPILVDSFHNDRWDYVHSIRKGRKKTKITRLSLYFKEDELVNIIGDIQPGVEVLNAIDRNEIIEVPLAKNDDDDSPWYSWMLWWKDETIKKPREPEVNAVNHSVRIPEIIEEMKKN